MESLTVHPWDESVIRGNEVVKPPRNRGALRFFGKFCAPFALALFVTCAPAQPAANTTRHMVDVTIHRSLPQQETEEWAKDAINNYINQQFSGADIRHRLIVDQIVASYDERQGCPSGGVKEGNICTYDDYSKIRLWLYKNGEEGDAPATSANPETAQIYMTIPGNAAAFSDSLSEDVSTKRTLTHETGHLFKMPDYYQEYVSSIHNYVAPIGIASYTQDIMTSGWYDHFSQTSKSFADKTPALPAGFGSPLWDIQYTPGNTVLRLLDDDGLPMRAISIEVFPQKWEYDKGPAHPIIPNKATFNGVTNDNGEFELGNYFKLFDTDGHTSSTSAFLRVTDGNEIKYAAITRSYLNTRYFQGNEDTAVIAVKFSSLHTAEQSLEQGKNLYLSAPGIVTQH